MLHESVHATLYVNDQSAFDESVASFVADRLTATWLSSTLGDDAPETRAWRALHAREHEEVALLHRSYEELDALYRSDATDEAKRGHKHSILSRASEALGGRALNNAVLGGFRTYDTGVPAFERLLARCEGSWPRFLDALKTLSPAAFGDAPRDDLDAILDRLAVVPLATNAR